MLVSPAKLKAYQNDVINGTATNNLPPGCLLACDELNNLRTLLSWFPDIDGKLDLAPLQPLATLLNHPATLEWLFEKFETLCSIDWSCITKMQLQLNPDQYEALLDSPAARKKFPNIIKKEVKTELAIMSQHFNTRLSELELQK